MAAPTAVPQSRSPAVPQYQAIVCPEGPSNPSFTPDHGDIEHPMIMYDIIIGVLSIIAMTLLVWFVWRVVKLGWRILVAVFAIAAGPVGDGKDDDEDHMSEGDFHSGPDGYSPNTAYPETQYGSGFDEEAEWNQ